MGNSFTKYNDIDEGIVILNTRGIILYNNKKSEKIFDYRNTFPTNIFSLIPDYQLDYHKKYIKNLEKGISNKYINYRICNVTIKTLNITIIPKNFGKIMLIIKDLTQQNIYREFFNISKHFICSLTTDCKFIKINPHMLEQLNYNENNMLNKNFISFIHKDDLEYTCNKLINLGKVYQNCNITNRCKKKDGSYIYLDWDIKYIDIDNIFCIGSEVTSNILYKARLDLCESFLQQTEKLIDTGVWDLNINTNELIWSRGLKNIYELEEVNFTNYINQSHQEDKDILQNTINKCLIDEQSYMIIHKITGKKTGKMKYVKSRGSIIKILNERRLIGVVQDITESVMNEKTLMELKDKAVKNDNIKSSFIANVSHELRTPLNGIIGITELLKYTTGLSPKQQEYIDTLDHSCGLLLSIINNVLDFSKLEKNETYVEISEINIRNFVDIHTKLFRYNIERKQLYFDLKIDDKVPQIIKSDEMKLKQIIYNLLSNSLKFTIKGGIILHIFMYKDNLRLDIKDSGIGIEIDKQKNIFEPFIQADISTTRKYGGTGLGLTICRTYVKLLKGSISFTSEINIGSVFSVILPTDYVQKNTEKYKNTPYICIVEDNMSNQYILNEIIKNIYPDVYIEIFENGLVCLNDISCEKPPSLIFMDIHMPIMDGYTCTTALRQKGIKCPIIGISANHMSNEKLKCLKVGMDDFMLKPVDKELIKNIIITTIPEIKEPI